MFPTSAPIGNAPYIDAKGVYVEPRTYTKRDYAEYAKIVRRRNDISDGAKLTYLEILEFDWESKQTGACKGFAFPSVDTLCEMRGVGERTIRGHLQELINKGILSRMRRRNSSSVLYIEDVIQTRVEQHSSFEKPRTAKICRYQKPFLPAKAKTVPSLQSDNPERQKSAIAYIDETTRIHETTTKQDVVEKLERLKISGEKAQILAQSYPIAHIEAQIQELERRLRIGNARPSIHNPAGWLIAAIEYSQIVPVEKKLLPKMHPVYDEQGQITHYEAVEMEGMDC
jgi:hypothetical protein